jgi:hypothetical protein
MDREADGQPRQIHRDREDPAAVARVMVLNFLDRGDLAAVVVEIIPLSEQIVTAEMADLAAVVVQFTLMVHRPTLRAVMVGSVEVAVEPWVTVEPLLQDRAALAL